MIEIMSVILTNKSGQQTAMLHYLPVCGCETRAWFVAKALSTGQSASLPTDMVTVCGWRRKAYTFS